MAIFNSYVSLPEGNLGFHGNISGSHGNSMELYGLNVDLVGEIGISIITMGDWMGFIQQVWFFPDVEGKNYRKLWNLRGRLRIAFVTFASTWTWQIVFLLMYIAGKLETNRNHVFLYAYDLSNECVWFLCGYLPWMNEPSTTTILG